MPIAADVHGDYLCMHGGISPELHRTSDIDNVDRFKEPPLKGFLCDLLWSDPMDDRDARKMRFSPNPQRECSVKFGLDPVKDILRTNNFISIIRAHQVQVDGYKMHRWGGHAAFPSVITVFSAPNYCGEYNNKGAVILIENDKMNIKQYKDVQHPFHLPQGMDLFKWSVPFLIEKIGDMMEHLIKKSRANEIASPDSTGENVQEILRDQAHEQQVEKKRRREVLKQKILFVGRMSRMLKTIRNNANEIREIKASRPDHKLPAGILVGGSEQLHELMAKFHRARIADSQNESMPKNSRRLSLRTKQALGI
mmetsp:Transcript_13357/g.18245  ORF Transcript_13357/g.18245 Transcript_13357/m.18245 type:complete len:309 (+) Transcript_13357:725-1651(+)